jgi:hypothetical protein
MNAMNKLKLDYAGVHKCLMESFEGEGWDVVDNTIMRDNAEAWKEYGTLYWPSVTIN